MAHEKDDRQKPAPTEPHPGMMGDGTEEQNLNQTGNPKARISEDEVKEAFGTESTTQGETSKKS
ncbi:hypothetical protein [Lichenihabitans psoromatis]|uniref:hypothetical protein n=1 Tax=Lichenihabitans psoromatis TaxID=2528642 RepID=UPI00103681EC|nr:hypothetical protein [Lichenihabitans psoromatis]